MAATVTRGEAYRRARNLFELSQKSLEEEDGTPWAYHIQDLPPSHRPIPSSSEPQVTKYIYSSTLSHL